MIIKENEAIGFILFRIYSFQIYNFRFQINVGASGATDVTKYLKLSKIANFCGRGLRLLKNCCFSQSSLVVNNLLTNMKRLGVSFLCYD